MSMLFATTYPERVAGARSLRHLREAACATPTTRGRPTIEEHRANLDAVQRDWGGPTQVEHLGAERRGRRSIQEMVGPVPAAWRQPGRGAGGPGDDARNRCPRHPARDPRADARSFIAPATAASTSGAVATWPSGSRTRDSSSSRESTISSWVGDSDAIVDEIEEFLTGARHSAEPTRVLATVLFTDMVESTSRAVQLGDARWRALISDHDRLVRGELARFRGPRDRSERRRLSRHLRRAGACDPLRVLDRRARPRARDPGARRPAHRGARHHRVRDRRHRRPHRCARHEPCRSGRGPRLEHRARPGRRVRPLVLGSGHARAQGRARDVADPSRRAASG